MFGGPLKRKFQSRSFTRFVGFLFRRRTTFGVDVGSPTRRLCRHRRRRRRRCSDVRFVLLWWRRLRVWKEHGKTFQKYYKWLQGLSKWYYNYNCLNYYPRWHVDQDFLNCKKLPHHESHTTPPSEGNTKGPDAVYQIPKEVYLKPRTTRTR